MQKKNVCKCGSHRVVYVVQRGRGKKLEAFCEKCLPVEVVCKEKKTYAPSKMLKKT